jgi:hypothetical protein
MRLIVNVNYTDGYTFNFTESFPVVYESLEKFIEDFEDTVKRTIEETKPYQQTTFKLGGQKWDPFDFVNIGVFTMPEVCTVDDWFSTIEK